MNPFKVLRATNESFPSQRNSRSGWFLRDERPGEGIVTTISISTDRDSFLLFLFLHYITALLLATN